MTWAFQGDGYSLILTLGDYDPARFSIWLSERYEASRANHGLGQWPEFSWMTLFRSGGGKPLLRGPCGELSSFHFNLSHTKGAWAWVESREFPVGVDLERKDRRFQGDLLGRKWLSGAAHSALDLFTWTRMEAWAKAQGVSVLRTRKLGSLEDWGREEFLGISFPKIGSPPPAFQSWILAVALERSLTRV
jgi:hypothetical protein